MKGILLTLCISFVLFLPNGCTSRKQESRQNNENTKIPAQQKEPLSIGLIDQKGLNTLIRERHGKPLLLNIWATWCQPCIEEFPDLIKLAQTDSLVEVVGISVDYPDEIHSRVTPFLEKLKVPFKIYIAKFE